jgi:hypothetical protein
VATTPRRALGSLVRLLCRDARFTPRGVGAHRCWTRSSDGSCLTCPS